MAETQDALGLAPDLRGREIARKRGARDLWISRSHVAAAATASLALAVVAFGAGFLLGRDQATAAPGRAALTSELPADELLQLLARIDGNGAGAGASGAITFPDELRGAPPVALPPTAAPPAEAVVAPVGAPVDPVAPGEPPPTLHLPPGEAVVVGGPEAPAAEFTVVVGRHASATEAAESRARLARAGLDAWILTELVDGAPRFRVAVGRHASRAAADEALPLLAGVGGAVVEPVVTTSEAWTTQP